MVYAIPRVCPHYCYVYFLLICSENNKVSHYIISRRGGLYLIGDQTFTELPAVIDFYRKHFLDTTTLTEHVSVLCSRSTCYVAT